MSKSAASLWSTSASERNKQLKQYLPEGKKSQKPAAPNWRPRPPPGKTSAPPVGMIQRTVGNQQIKLVVCGIGWTESRQCLYCRRKRQQYFPHSGERSQS